MSSPENVEGRPEGRPPTGGSMPQPIIQEDMQAAADRARARARNEALGRYIVDDVIAWLGWFHFRKLRREGRAFWGRDRDDIYELDEVVYCLPDGTAITGRMVVLGQAAWRLHRELGIPWGDPRITKSLKRDYWRIINGSDTLREKANKKIRRELQHEVRHEAVTELRRELGAEPIELEIKARIRSIWAGRDKEVEARVEEELQRTVAEALPRSSTSVIEPDEYARLTEFVQVISELADPPLTELERRGGEAFVANFVNGERGRKTPQTERFLRKVRKIDQRRLQTTVALDAGLGRLVDQLDLVWPSRDPAETLDD